ncbi:MAG: carbohydrate ABC transporter permease [Oscillospiraceae bacterium]
MKKGIVGKRISRFAIYVVLIIITFIVAFPFVFMIFSSFKDIKEFYVTPPKLLPEQFKLDNYIELFSKGNFGRYYINSIFVTAIQVAGNLLVVLGAGYGFAKYDFKGKNQLFMLVLACTMVPWVATIIPLYIMANTFNVVDTYTGLIIPGLVDAMSIFLARNFMTSIPTPLLEAARIDGAGEFKIFTKIVLPTVKPLIAVISIQKLVGSWNAFQWPLLIVNSDDLRTLPVAIAKFSTQYYDAYDIKMAAACVAIIPVLLLYIAFQKYFVEGISLSGIK